MQRSTWLTMAGLFLAATLLGAVPGFAQTQGWTCPRGYTPGAGPGRGGGPGYCGYYNPQTSPQYGSGKQARNRGRARWNNPPAAPATPNPQTQTPAPQSSN